MVHIQSPLKKKGKRIITYKLHPLCWMTYLKCADWFRLQPHIYLAINGPNRTSIGIHTLLNILVNTIHRGGDRAFYVCFLHICLIESVDVFRIYYLGLYIQHRWRDIYMYKDTMYRVYFSCNTGTIPFIRWQLTRPTVHKSYPLFFWKKKVSSNEDIEREGEEGNEFRYLASDSYIGWVPLRWLLKCGGSQKRSSLYISLALYWRLKTSPQFSLYILDCGRGTWKKIKAERKENWLVPLFILLCSLLLTLFASYK